MLRRLILLGEVVLSVGLCGTAWGGAQALYPYPCATPCVPNTAGFGYFPTHWRQWPGEDRLPQTNPKAVGAEVMPTPEGHEAVAPPVAVPGGQGPSGAPGGEILPPSGTILPPQEPPAEPKGEKPPKGAPEGLPGLPPDTGPGALPALPGGEQPKPESKPKSQAPSAKGGTLSDATEQVPMGTEAGNAAQVTNQVAVGSSDERQVQPGTVISLVEPGSAQSGHVALTTNRADSIATAAPLAPRREIEPMAYATVEPAAATGAGKGDSAVFVDTKDGTVPATPAEPRMAMKGFCPVELVRNGRWTPGDLRFTVVYDGWIYRLAGPAQRREFQAHPEAFTPAYAGDDPVLRVDEHRSAPGQLTYCATYNGRLYVFASAATQAQFDKDPQRYAARQ